MNLTLPTDSTERKSYSIASGCLAYFPAALAGVAKHSFVAGAKHTQGRLVHKRWLSADHDDCIERHLMDMRDMRALLGRLANPAIGSSDATKKLHAAVLDEANALAWRALALSQALHEQYGGAPLAPAAELSDAPVAHRADTVLREVLQSAPVTPTTATEREILRSKPGDGGEGLPIVLCSKCLARLVPHDTHKCPEPV